MISINMTTQNMQLYSDNMKDIFSYSDIPHCFDKIPWKIGENYEVRICNIYDPSKIWIVPFHKELSVFHDYLNEFYTEKADEYKIPEDNIKIGVYCVVLSDYAYYRGIIVNIPQFTTLHTKVVVYLFDFGFTCATDIENMFSLCEKMIKVPCFAVRASLTDLEPIDSIMWTNKVTQRLNELTKGKVLLCVLEYVDIEAKTLHIKLGEIIDLNQVVNISDTLIKEKLAKVSLSSSRIKTVTEGKLKPKVLYPHLFPSHQAIETNLMPNSVHVTELIKTCPASAAHLFKPYYTLIP